MLVFTLYADYAIVIDDLGLWQSFRASLHVLLRRSVGLLAATAVVWLVLSFVMSRRRSGRPSTAAQRRSP